MTRVTELATKVDHRDPDVALPAVAALRRLLDDLEAAHVQRARDQGWSWDDIATRLGVTRQTVHRKYANRMRRRS